MATDSSKSKWDFKAKYEIGNPIFLKLFEMPAAELRVKLLEIVKGKLHENSHDILIKGDVHKETKNDEPSSLEIWFYSSISVSPFGIFYKPEHGEGKQIVEFDQNFKFE